MIANHPASKAARACICAMATLLLAACASEPQTVSSQDSSIDFSRYRTYAFLADLAEAEILELIQGTVLEDAEIVRVSSTTGWRPSMISTESLSDRCGRT